MTTVTLKGTPFSISGSLPLVGSIAPEFSLTASDLSTISLAGYRGKRVVLNIFPSLDTPTCATSVRKFNRLVGSLSNAEVIAISKDLPFAFGRFCSIEGVEHVVGASAFRDASFGRDYGVLLTEGPLEGLFARALVVLDEEGVVIYTELVDEIAREPNYEAALTAIG